MANFNKVYADRRLVQRPARSRTFSQRRQSGQVRLRGEQPPKKNQDNGRMGRVIRSSSTSRRSTATTGRKLGRPGRAVPDKGRQVLHRRPLRAGRMDRQGRRRKRAKLVVVVDDFQFLDTGGRHGPAMAAGASAGCSRLAVPLVQRRLAYGERRMELPAGRRRAMSRRASGSFLRPRRRTLAAAWGRVDAARRRDPVLSRKCRFPRSETRKRGRSTWQQKRSSAIRS